MRPWILLAVLCVVTEAARAEPAKRIGMMLEMATIRRHDVPGAHLGMTIGVAWFGSPVVPWVELGSYNLQPDEIVATSGPNLGDVSWHAIRPRLNLYEHKKPTVHEVSAGALLRWPTPTGLRPFVRGGAGYYLDEILDYEFALAADGSTIVPYVSSHRQWQAGVNLGLGIQGEKKGSAISPIVEFRWQLTRLYRTSKSSLFSAHAGLWLHP